MKTLYRSLSEKDRRRYAAVEVDKLGYGGAEYISGLFSIDPKTIRHGLFDLDEPEDPEGPRVRKRGGGRKRKTSGTPEAGSPPIAKEDLIQTTSLSQRPVRAHC